MGNSKSKIPKELLADLEKTTYFDKAQIRDWYKDFVKDCPSGQLGKAQFSDIYKKFFPPGDPGQFTDYVFNVFDENRDGVVDFKELICALSVISRGTLDEKLKWTFQLYDMDGDKHITYDEMLQIVRALYKMTGIEDAPETRVDKVFEAMDINKDAKLTCDEFVEGTKRDATLVKFFSLFKI